MQVYVEKPKCTGMFTALTITLSGVQIKSQIGFCHVNGDVAPEADKWKGT